MVQGPFSVEHLQALQACEAVQDDTLITAAAKGPSLLKEVMQMYESHRASPPVRYRLKDASPRSNFHHVSAHLRCM